MKIVFIFLFTVCFGLSNTLTQAQTSWQTNETEAYRLVNFILTPHTVLFEKRIPLQINLLKGIVYDNPDIYKIFTDSIGYGFEVEPSTNISDSLWNFKSLKRFKKLSQPNLIKFKKRQKANEPVAKRFFLKYYKRGYVEVSRPLFSGDFKYALIQVNSLCVTDGINMCSCWLTYLYEKKGNSWVEVNHWGACS